MRDTHTLIFFDSPTPGARPGARKHRAPELL